jgi:hypothetical protein
MELLLTEALRSGSSTMLEECQAWGRKHCASTQCSPETASHLEAAAAAATSLAAAASAAVLMNKGIMEMSIFMFTL